MSFCARVCQRLDQRGWVFHSHSRYTVTLGRVADLPATVVAASSFDDMIAITGCGAVPPQPSESLPNGSCTSPLGPLAAAAPVCQAWHR
jgi:hypothetical protein